MHLHDLEHWMWAEACQILNRADRLHRQFFRPMVMNGKRPAWEPPIDVYETTNGFKIVAALPGVEPEQVSVTQEGDSLIIAGQRNLPDPAEANIHRLEIPYGRFERYIRLSAGHFEMVSRELTNGCLIIELRK